jgi:hypothetical protein
MSKASKVESTVWSILMDMVLEKEIDRKAGIMLFDVMQKAMCFIMMRKPSIYPEGPEGVCAVWSVGNESLKLYCSGNSHVVVQYLINNEEQRLFIYDVNYEFGSLRTVLEQYVLIWSRIDQLLSSASKKDQL